MIDHSPEIVKEIGGYLPDCRLIVAEDFEDFEEKMNSGVYDCLIIDITHMTAGAMDLIRRVKLANKRSGLIITSGKDSLQERVEAFTIGADDFLTKPYDVSELAARIVSLVRRVTMLNQQDMVYNEIRVGVNAKVVFVNGLEVDLTKKELDLLMYFIEHKNSVVKKDSLISHLSGHLKGVKNNSDIIYAHVKNLKKKLTEAGCQTYLRTIYGIGYKWEEI